MVLIVLVSISLPSTVSIPSEMADWVVELALPLDPTPKFGTRYFWFEGYYVSTVGFNEATVKKYIREQELHDQMKDKLSVKEYENPFNGSK